MALTQEDLQAIGALMDSKLAAVLEPIRADIADLKQGQAAMQDDITQIKEDTAVTRETTNGLGEWAEIVADVLRVEYPVKK